MFKIDKIQDTYTWKIEVKMPNNGQFDKIPVKVRYNRLPHDERVALLEQLTNAADDDAVAQGLEQDFFDKVFAGWEKGQIKDESGDIIDDEAGKAKVLGITEFRLAVTQGYFESIGGDAGKSNGLKA